MSIYADVDLATISGDSKTCGICLSEYDAEDRVTETKCHHLFHDACREEWRKMPAGQDCPTCKTKDIRVLTADEIEDLEFVDVVLEDGSDRIVSLTANPQIIASKLNEIEGLSDEDAFNIAHNIARHFSANALMIPEGDPMKFIKNLMLASMNEYFQNTEGLEPLGEVHIKAVEVLNEYFEGLQLNFGKTMFSKASAGLKCKMIRTVVSSIFNSMPTKYQILTAATTAIYVGWSFYSSYVNFRELTGL